MKKNSAVLITLMLACAVRAQTADKDLPLNLQFNYVYQFAQEGIPAAMHICGVYLETGVYNTEKNMDEALFMYNEAAKRGYLEAYEALARCYRDGTGVERDSRKAEYYQGKYNETSAAMGGFKPARVKYGEKDFYRGKLRQQSTDLSYGSDAEDEGDYDAMMYYYYRAAVMGDKLAQYAIAKAYDDGKMVGQDYDKAIFWYEVVADGDSFTNAPIRLGEMYMNGIGTPVDYKKAVHYYEKASGEGSTESMKILEDIYRNGREGVPADAEKADYWHKKLEENSDDIYDSLFWLFLGL